MNLVIMEVFTMASFTVHKDKDEAGHFVLNVSMKSLQAFSIDNHHFHPLTAKAKKLKNTVMCDFYPPKKDEDQSFHPHVCSFWPWSPLLQETKLILHPNIFSLLLCMHGV